MVTATLSFTLDAVVAVMCATVAIPTAAFNSGAIVTRVIRASSVEQSARPGHNPLISVNANWDVYYLYKDSRHEHERIHQVAGHEVCDGYWSPTVYLMYLSMNFLWNSERSVSLMNGVDLDLSGSLRAQFLNTTSSSLVKREERREDDVKSRNRTKTNLENLPPAFDLKVGLARAEQRIAA